jgi:hypothetical protein
MIVPSFDLSTSVLSVFLCTDVRIVLLDISYHGINVFMQIHVTVGEVVRKWDTLKARR